MILLVPGTVHVLRVPITTVLVDRKYIGMNTHFVQLYPGIPWDARTTDAYEYVSMFHTAVISYVS